MFSDTLLGAAGGLGGGKLKVQEFLASDVWVKPANVETIYVFMVGGGGSGGAGNATAAGSGGAGGEVVERLISVTGNVTVTIGAGGASTAAMGLKGGVTSLSGGCTLKALAGLGGLSPLGAGSGTGGAYELDVNFIANTSGANHSANTHGAGGGAGAGGNGEAHPANLEVVTGAVYSTGKGHIGGFAVSNGVGFGGKGIKGFGGGGGGGAGSASTWYGLGQDGGGNGGNPNTAGRNAITNTGSGGGGAGYSSTGVTYNGGTGAAGYCLIAWSE